MWITNKRGTFYIPEVIPEEFKIDGGIYKLYERDKDAEESEKYQRKELYRLQKVMSGYENKKQKMMFVYRVNDKTMSGNAREKAWQKLESTKSWRGLMYDMDYVRKEIDAIEEYLKRKG